MKVGLSRCKKKSPRTVGSRKKRNGVPDDQVLHPEGSRKSPNDAPKKIATLEGIRNFLENRLTLPNKSTGELAASAIRKEEGKTLNRIGARAKGRRKIEGKGRGGCENWLSVESSASKQKEVMGIGTPEPEIIVLNESPFKGNLDNQAKSTVINTPAVVPSPMIPLSRVALECIGSSGSGSFQQLAISISNERSVVTSGTKLGRPKNVLRRSRRIGIGSKLEPPAPNVGNEAKKKIEDTENPHPSSRVDLKQWKIKECRVYLSRCDKEMGSKAAAAAQQVSSVPVPMPFRRAWNKRRHSSRFCWILRRHAGERAKPWKCDLCSKSYLFQSILKRHFLSVGHLGLIAKVETGGGTQADV